MIIITKSYWNHTIFKYTIFSFLIRLILLYAIYFENCMGSAYGMHACEIFVKKIIWMLRSRIRKISILVGTITNMEWINKLCKSTNGQQAILLKLTLSSHSPFVFCSPFFSLSVCFCCSWKDLPYTSDKNKIRKMMKGLILIRLVNNQHP